MTEQTEETTPDVGIGAVLVGATGYLILKKSDGGWVEVAVRPSFKSGEAAIRAVVAKLAESDQSGTFVAVPARSWKPVSVTAKVTTAIVLEGVKP